MSNAKYYQLQAVRPVVGPFHSIFHSICVLRLPITFDIWFIYNLPEIFEFTGKIHVHIFAL